MLFVAIRVYEEYARYAAIDDRLFNHSLEPAWNFHFDLHTDIVEILVKNHPRLKAETL